MDFYLESICQNLSNHSKRLNRDSFGDDSEDLYILFVAGDGG